MTFSQELKKLNKQQREAVEAIEGPVMVVAGPGTGKTQILTLRIANILQKTDTTPESILALTFTESAVASMRKRLSEVAGGAVAGKVAIKTIHGFCNEVISNHPESFPEIAGGQSVGDVEPIRIVRELLDSGDFELLRSFGDPYRSVRDILSAIGTLKREGKTPADFKKIVSTEEKEFSDIPDLYNEKGAYKGQMKGKYLTLQKRIAKHKELVALYERYQAVLKKRREYDYDDMILSVARALRSDRDLRFILQEQYLYLLVDEHQDTNQSQSEVIELLASFHDDPNLFVVGDAKQAIYRFQGASLENFEYFKARFKNARIITLTDNYRSTQTILDSALTITLTDNVSLRAKAGHAEHPIKVVAVSSPDHEPYVVARHISERIKKGRIKPEDIAILYRNNKDAESYAGMLSKLGVPYRLLAEESIFDAPIIKKVLLLLEAVQNFGKDYALIPVLFLDISQIAPLDVALLIDASREHRVSTFQLVRDVEVLKKIVPESAERIFAIYEKLSLWKAMSKSFSILPMYEAIVRDSGILTQALASADGPALLAKVNALMTEISRVIERRSNASLDDVLEHLSIMREHHLHPSLPASTDTPSAVSLLTAHKSKGMEFPYVYIVGATHKHWEGKRDRDFIKLPESVFRRSGSSASSVSARGNPEPEEDEYEDERNLFYVAVTRAKKELIISYSAKNEDKDDQDPSLFVTGIRSELVEQVSSEKLEKEFLAHPEIMFKEAQKISEPPLKEKEFLVKRFLERGLSVSALNNYLECPAKFYLSNLVGMREAPNPSAQAGNSAHGALKYAIDSMSLRAERSNLVSKKDFLNRFRFLLSREPMREIDFNEALKKGERALGAYFDEYHKTWNANMKPEYPVEVEFDVDKKTTIPLRGRFDRIDLLDGGTVRVVDYKFKKPMSRNEIAGLTKTSDGNYYRQLTFYKILIEEGTKWKMKEASLDFLEPSSAKASEGQARPKFKQEVFAPSEKEVADLKKEIARIAKEIINFEFYGKKCDDKKCRYCGLNEYLGKI